MKSILSALLLLFAASCSVGPVYEPPCIELPSQWHSECPEQELCIQNEIWWKSLNDPTLDRLMDYAAEQNIDLQIAALRVLQARMETKSKKGDLYPRLDGSANCGHVYYSKDALVNGLIGRAVPYTSDHVRRNVNFFELGFDVEWEFDLFGMTAHDIAALKAQEEGLQESLCAVWVTLSAEIARNYVELRGLQSRIQVVKDLIQNQNEAIANTQDLFDRGLVNEIDVSTLHGELNEVQAELPLLEVNAARSIYRLSILLGYPPGELFDCLEFTCALPSIPCKPSIGVPSELLRRRPDIRKAERDLAAATERVGSAIAALFPRFSLRGFIGDISTQAGSIFSPASATWMAGPQLLLPIFNSRLLLQDVEYNKISTQVALLNYQKTVLEALEETENAIASYQVEEKREKLLEENFTRFKKSVEFSEELYAKGLIDHKTKITTAKIMLNSHTKYIDSQVTRLLNYISLHKAFGGSWED